MEKWRKGDFLTTSVKEYLGEIKYFQSQFINSKIPPTKESEIKKKETIVSLDNKIAKIYSILKEYTKETVKLNEEMISYVGKKYSFFIFTTIIYLLNIILYYFILFLFYCSTFFHHIYFQTTTKKIVQIPKAAEVHRNILNSNRSEFDNEEESFVLPFLNDVSGRSFEILGDMIHKKKEIKVNCIPIIRESLEEQESEEISSKIFDTAIKFFRNNPFILYDSNSVYPFITYLISRFNRLDPNALKAKSNILRLLKVFLFTFFLFFHIFIYF